MPGRGRSCLFRPKANLPACLYESYILHYLLLERDGCAWEAWALCTNLYCRLPVYQFKNLPALPPHRCPPTLCTNQPFWICSTTRYICYIVAFFCRLYSVPSLPPTSNRAMPHCGMFVKVDKAIKMAPYGRAGSGLPMPCTVPRLPGLIHCVQLPTLPLPLASFEQRPYTLISTLVAVLLCGCTPLLYSSVDDFAVHILQLH